MPKATAFKVNTHVWVGSEVLKDIEECTKLNATPCIRIYVKSGKDFSDVKKINISQKVYQSITQWPDYYLAGTLGPDAYPGIYEGQTVIHPGVTKLDANVLLKNGFGTGEFADYLLKRAYKLKDETERAQAIAFSYGFLSHAASDVFAHTYVNTYAGGLFSLTDHEIEVEQRHMAIENFIEQKTPDSLTQHLKILNRDGIAAPTKFISDSLIMNDVMAEQYKKSNVPHLYLVNKLRVALEDQLCQKKSEFDEKDSAKRLYRHFVKQYTAEHSLDSGSENLISSKSKENSYVKIFNKIRKREFSKGCPIQKAEVLALQIVFFIYADYWLTNAEAEKVIEIKQKIDGVLKKGPREIHRASKHLDKLSVELFKIGVDRKVLEHEIIANTVKNAVHTANDILEVEEDLIQLQKEKRDLQLKISKYVCEMAQGACPKSDFTAAKITDISCRFLSRKNWKECNKSILEEGFCDGICLAKNLLGDCVFRAKPRSCKIKKCVAPVHVRIHKENGVCKKTALELDKIKYRACLVSIQSQCDVAQSVFKAATQVEIDLLNSRIENLRELHAELIADLDKSKKIVAEAGQVLQKKYVEMIELKQAHESDIIALAERTMDGIRSALQGWLDDLHLSMREYVHANTKAIHITMNKKEKVHFWSPIIKWWSCYSPVFYGVPSPAVDLAVCNLKSARDRIAELKSDLQNIAIQHGPGDIRKHYNKVEKFIDELPLKLAEEVGDEFAKLIKRPDANPEFLIHATKSDMTSDNLNDIFRWDDSRSGFLSFKYRKNDKISERILYDMHIDKMDKYFNADLFTPIYNSVVLSKLSLLDALLLNSLNKELGVREELYNPKLNNNILTHSLFSIDGNHQWMQLAPPYLRAVGQPLDVAWMSTVSSRSSENMLRRFALQESDQQAFGFKIFTNCIARKNIFYRIFKAPLVRSLESDQFLNKISPLYPLIISELAPFGELEQDQVCEK